VTAGLVAAAVSLVLGAAAETGVTAAAECVCGPRYEADGAVFSMDADGEASSTNTPESRASEDCPAWAGVLAVAATTPGREAVDMMPGRPAAAGFRLGEAVGGVMVCSSPTSPLSSSNKSSSRRLASAARVRDAGDSMILPRQKWLLNEGLCGL